MASALFETVGSSVRREYARRDDGQWFTRFQDRHPRFGYRWTRWTPTTEPAKAEWVEGVPGLSDGGWSYGVVESARQVAVRLPKGEV